MYTKNLTNDFRLRLSDADMDFLKSLSEERGQSISEVTRSIIGEYRRSLETLKTLSKALELTSNADNFKSLINKEGQLSNGDTKTDINN